MQAELEDAVARPVAWDLAMSARHACHQVGGASLRVLVVLRFGPVEDGDATFRIIDRELMRESGRGLALPRRCCIHHQAPRHIIRANVSLLCHRSLVGDVGSLVAIDGEPLRFEVVAL